MANRVAEKVRYFLCFRESVALRRGLSFLTGPILQTLRMPKFLPFETRRLATFPRNLFSCRTSRCWRTSCCLKRFETAKKSIADLTDVDIASKLEALGIAHLVQEMPAELSGGELKRAAIARALVNKPEIVIADEPTSNLDEINAKIVFELLAEFAQSGTSVLVATHDPRGFKYGDRVYTMHKGHLLPSGESDFGGL